MKKPTEIKVLLVDDDDQVLEMFVSLFDSLGFKVDSSVNGKEAFEKLLQAEKNNIPYDVILSDIRMPIMDGVELLKKIKTHNVLIPSVLLISGYSDYSIEDLYGMGADGVFEKPFRAASVRDAIQRGSLSLIEQWSVHNPSKSELNLKFTFKDIHELLKSNVIRLGRGGFSYLGKDFQASIHNSLDFEFDFQNTQDLPSIKGQAIVRWNRAPKLDESFPGFGVEIKFLDESCRQKYFDFIQAQKLSSYIPKIKV